MHLVIEGLRKRYSPTGPWALQGVDLQVNRGEFIAILGSSGAGKSTLIRCINRLVEPTGGSVRLDGQDLMTLDARELRAQRRRIGMIFQEFNLIDRLDVLTNVLAGRFGTLPTWRVVLGRFPAADVELARHNLRRVGLEEYASRRARELSGGQRQRVAIARALTQRPEIILGDEPVSNLDPATSRGVMGLLQEVNRRDGLTVILNLHSVELAREYARRVVGMRAGRIVFDGSPESLTEADLQAIYGMEPEPGTDTQVPLTLSPPNT